ncbi:bifunctional diaminohydroxyphosphoribosylaminopyrimidine deaminase/5-amino-6-(5-phosphoribosylamino)uracil reductase RibD [Pseudalkalibacillus salsuginis]|uniref:bifunctional diaminohydroxyphosphoribosylaminopyrimidine deaminase/5-amino-6-(5-phosphoribosylamino)uracil reductase RibD n=1 Tax=Pseudalkalibacillus salsuginis TaxID=2910972 RepID=UPI001F01960C|nr:bifunctional diaminohydroxyphosphoribosylaminopyrimidine deaminase/5-amino-6-(5-phosphoribosylamino)uracil reductase RibD [Pseudalkalibacillus salsuginis]MCF6408291.1 bifunctional diaminohydroxyphosphoribosylaminopyrimidine deaminase/5-amino-6-(5-phosphoribosylamino)uracil reductase RibD [Pseudalkalibacillus salsuginis]
MEHARYMNLAIEMAKQTPGQTAPNPKVGAVVVKNGEIVGLGAHLKAGEGHAEVHALQMAGDNAKGATMYVTLEPCSHHGKTPPCADLVIERGIQTIYIATTDPNPLVAGRGIKRLKQAGLDVNVGLNEQSAVALNPIFNHFMRTNLPFVTLKSASSMDGKIATKTGHSKWITGPEARLDVHRYRHEHDAILVGIDTIIKDDPSLTTRLPSGGKNPIRLVMDTHLRIPKQSKVLNDRESPTWIITGNQVSGTEIQAFQNDHVRILKMPEEKISIHALLERLAQERITSIFIEGGGTIHASFIKEKAFQQIVTYLAPMLIGGQSSPSLIGGEGIERISDAMELEMISYEKIGKDLKIVSIPKGRS